MDFDEFVTKNLAIEEIHELIPTTEFALNTPEGLRKLADYMDLLLQEKRYDHFLMDNADLFGVSYETHDQATARIVRAWHIFEQQEQNRNEQKSFIDRVLSKHSHLEYDTASPLMRSLRNPEQREVIAASMVAPVIRWEAQFYHVSSGEQALLPGNFYDKETGERVVVEWYN